MSAAVTASDRSPRDRIMTSPLILMRYICALRPPPLRHEQPRRCGSKTRQCNRSQGVINLGVQRNDSKRCRCENSLTAQPRRSIAQLPCRQSDEDRDEGRENEEAWHPRFDGKFQIVVMRAVGQRGVYQFKAFDGHEHRLERAHARTNRKVGLRGV